MSNILCKYMYTYIYIFKRMVLVLLCFEPLCKIAMLVFVIFFAVFSCNSADAWVRPLDPGFCQRWLFFVFCCPSSLGTRGWLSNIGVLLFLLKFIWCLGKWKLLRILAQQSCFCPLLFGGFASHRYPQSDDSTASQSGAWIPLQHWAVRCWTSRNWKCQHHQPRKVLHPRKLTAGT